MKRNILIFVTGLLLMTGSAFAQDVKIDGSGNLTTGSSNSGANLDVIGSSGEDGIVGSASGTGASGVYGINTDNNNYGTLGHTDYGVYGNSSSGAAGFFEGNAEVTGHLTVGGNISGNIIETDPNVNALGKASLSCSDGQVAKFSGGSWACDSDTDTDTDTIRSEAEVEGFITNGPIDLDAGSTIGGTGIAAVDHTHSGSGGYGGVAIVATSGGDYTDPLNAMNDSGTWCGIPSEINRCVLRIMPGVYNIGSNPLHMKSYIDIEGSGENVTVIEGSVDNDDFFFITIGLIFGADNAELRSLTIENTSAGSQTIAMINDGTSPRVTNVTALSSLGVVNYGMYNKTSNAKIHNVTVDAPGSNGTAGIYNDDVCSVEITSSRVKGGDYSVTASPNAITVIAGTKLDGAVTAPPNTIKCFAAYDASYGAAVCP